MDEWAAEPRSSRKLHIRSLPDNPISSMPTIFKRSFFLLTLLGLAWAAYIAASFHTEDSSKSAQKNRPSTAPKATSPALSILASAPDWSTLEIYQNTITRGEFESLLTTVFTTGDAWQAYLEIDATEARIKTSSTPTDSIFHLHFAKAEARPPRHWRTAAELPPATPERPLEGLKVALDAGHIGGEWAKMEERWFVVGSGTPVCEGDMTLQVANLLKPRLEALGAIVSLVRKNSEPVTPVRPTDLQALALNSSTPGDSPAALQKLAERLFYRTAEIHSRAELVNHTLKPDLVLCLHFNAEAWGDPNEPTLIDHSHLHLLLNGAYTDEEVILADQRLALLQKLLAQTHREEALIGATVASAFAEISHLPPYIYPSESTNSRPCVGQPYLWIRNLLANRLYNCPVIFMEPYVMNSTIDYARIQAGDYTGLRDIGGKMLPSLFREYADAVTVGLSRHYSQGRVPVTTTDGH
jgi:N-acetylmuramoyl-L-alanine amidase